MKFLTLVSNASTYSFFTILIGIILMQCLKLFVFLQDSSSQNSIHTSEKPDLIFKLKNTYKLNTKSIEEIPLSYRSASRYELKGSISTHLNDENFLSTEKIVHTNNHGTDEPNVSVLTLSQTNLLKLNRLINLSKKILFLNLVFSCNIYNLMLVSYLMKNCVSSIKKYFSKRFLQAHLGINLSIMALNNLNNLIFILCQKNEFYKVNIKEVQSRKSLNNFILHYLKPQKFPNPKSAFNDYIEKRADADTFSLEEYFTESFCIKANLFFMLISIFLMAFYAFLLNSILISDEKLISKNDEEKQNSSLFQKFKTNKLRKLITTEYQYILHSILVIYLLSIWDMFDVYNHSRIHQLNLETVRLTNQLNTNDLLQSMIHVKDLQRSNSLNEFGQNNHFFIRKYFANYQQIIEHNTKHSLKSHPGKDGDLEQELVADSYLKIMFLFKENRHSFDSLLVICFSVLIIIKLDNVHKKSASFRRIEYEKLRPVLLM